MPAARERRRPGRRRSAVRRSAPPPIRARWRTPSDSARDRPACRRARMYGGSGTWPSASTAASSVGAPSTVESQQRGGRRSGARAPRRRGARRARAPASSNTIRAPGFQLLPGMDERLALAVRRQRSSSRHSTAPPLGSRRPSSRAGNTRVSLATTRSPGVSSRGRSANRPLPATSRRRDRRRAAATARAAAAPARSARRAGRSRSRRRSMVASA